MRTIEELHKILGPGNFGHIARVSGLSRQTISRVLRGLTKNGTNMRRAFLIAETAKVSLDELWTYISHQYDQRHAKAA